MLIRTILYGAVISAMSIQIFSAFIFAFFRCGANVKILFLYRGNTPTPPSKAISIDALLAGSCVALGIGGSCLLGRITIGSFRRVPFLNRLSGSTPRKDWKNVAFSLSEYLKLVIKKKYLRWRVGGIFDIF